MRKSKTTILMPSAIITVAFLITVLGWNAMSAAQQNPELPSIQKAVICEKVDNLTPGGIRQIYPSTIGKLYCFTQLTEIPTEGTIYHIWYHGAVEMAKIELSISPPQWRTYSSKIIVPSWKGSWRVEIVYGDHVLRTLAFAVQ